jgi:hypothetical protein
MQDAGCFATGEVRPTHAPGLEARRTPSGEAPRAS